jgi:hypothetical protein
MNHSAILTLARTGATSRAWKAFIAAGLDGANEVEALTLKGRLLKDRAKQAAGRSGWLCLRKAGQLTAKPPASAPTVIR